MGLVDVEFVCLRILEAVAEPYHSWFLPSLSPHQSMNIHKTGTEPQLCFQGSWVCDKLRWVLPEWQEGSVRQTLQSSELGNRKDSFQKSIKAGLVILAAQESEEGESQFLALQSEFKASLASIVRPCLKIKSERWLMAQYTPRFNPQYCSKQNKEKFPHLLQGVTCQGPHPVGVTLPQARLFSTNTPKEALCGASGRPG